MFFIRSKSIYGILTLRVIGLHLTKCAGSSIVSSVKRNLSANQFYLCSSVIENIKMGQEDFSSRFSLAELKFIFGHYVHESLHSIYRERDCIWLTVLRDPRLRVKSEWDQIYNIRKTYGLKPLTVDEFLINYQNSLCAELLRAFPSLNVNQNQVENALRALDLFDYVINSTQIELIIGKIHQVLDVDVEDRQYIRENISSEKIYLNGSHYEEQTQNLVERIANLNSDDIELYKASQHLFKESLGVSASEKFDRREEFIPIIDQRDAVENFKFHLIKYYKSEIDLTDNKKMFRDYFSRQEDWFQSFKQALNIS
jgi:hypothetical protein